MLAWRPMHCNLALHQSMLHPFCFRYEMGRVPSNTKLSANTCVRKVRVRGGSNKFRALRLDHGTYSWGSEVCVCLQH
jgi:ribosomal protein S8E